MFNAELCHDTHSYLPQAVIAAAVAFSMSLAAAAGTTWHVSVSTEGNQASCSNPEFFCCSIYSCATTVVSECRDALGGSPPWAAVSDAAFCDVVNSYLFSSGKDLAACLLSSEASCRFERRVSVLRRHHALYCHGLSSSSVWSEQHQHSNSKAVGASQCHVVFLQLREKI